MKRILLVALLLINFNVLAGETPSDLSRSEDKGIIREIGVGLIVAVGGEIIHRVADRVTQPSKPAERPSPQPRPEPPHRGADPRPEPCPGPGNAML